MKRRVFPLHFLVTGLLVLCLGLPGGLLVWSQYLARKEHAFAEAGIQLRTLKHEAPKPRGKGILVQDVAALLAALRERGLSA